MKRLSREQVLDLLRSMVRTAEPDARIIIYELPVRSDARDNSDGDVVILPNKPPMTHQKRYRVT